MKKIALFLIGLCLFSSCKNKEDNTIKYTISKELGIEIVGDTKVKIAVSNDEDDYDIIVDEKEINSEIDKEVKTNYLENK